MIPGPDRIIACPTCKGLARHMTLVSGNTCGMRMWTDGKQDAPMLPHPPAVVRCRHCGECYWLADAKEIGLEDRAHAISARFADEDHDAGALPASPASRAAEQVQEPTEEQYYEAIEKGLAENPEQEKYLRILAWWKRNDACRDIPLAQAGDVPASIGLWKKNLEALVTLLDGKDDNDRFMKAEVLRELGEFESARQIISSIRSRKWAAIVRQLRSLCNNGDTYVRELHWDR